MKRQPPEVDTDPVNQQALLRHPEAELLQLYGSHPLAFFGLAEDVEHFLVPGGQGMINYRLVNRVAVVLGDPLCAPQAVEEVMRSFLAFCRARRWHVAVYQTRPTHLAIYHALQLRVFKMGEEAMLFPQTFTLQGAALANVRTSCRRAERERVSIQWYEGAPPSAVMQQLASVSAAWLEGKGGRQAEETGFSTGRLDEILMSAQHADQIAALDMPSSEVLPAPSLVTGVALTDAGQACAFMTFTPIYGATRDEAGVQQHWGWALDMMRRSPQAPPGVMELLLIRAMERFRACGAQRVSLGLVALADTRQEMASAERQFASFAINRMGPSGSRQALLTFKQKFAPCWESRYLVASSRLALPNIALAVLRLRNYSRKGLVRLFTTR
jgi:lysylphosphatidylglycerol synthetase-like protein (DUF2156 family)